MDTDIRIPNYTTNLFSNADIFLLASQLKSIIDQTFQERKLQGNPYERVVLIGHSVGAVLLRKAYVYGMGATDDHPFHKAPTQAKEWTEKVERLVLLAGMNRGWDVSPRPRHMSTVKFIRYWFLIRVATLTRTGRFILSLRRGTPFISNLRIQWLRLCQNFPERVAPAIQLLGDTDDFVGREDSKDLAAAANFIYIPVPASGHYDILNFGGWHGGVREKLFLEAANTDIVFLRTKHYDATNEVHNTPTTLHKAKGSDNAERSGDIVFLLHGIRDFGSWTRQLEDTFKRKDKTVQVITSGYGYFPLLRFLILGARRRNVRQFMDWYTEELARNPKRSISFVGHSNATFIFARAICEFPFL